ncbi:MAG: EAL domain-containing protein [Sulfuricaulis sp.]|uniref:bifunctional diguanylate cyclase/phosphodiesterase n=1 Tax=Sulfuricaulis sp. TaxID=2003553 RepID=UPI003C61AECA
MRHSITGLRTRLMLLVGFAVIPAFGLMGYTAISQRQQAAVNAERDAIKLVRLAAQEQSQLIAATHQLLLILSQLPAVNQPTTATACGRILDDLRKPYPYYTNFGVATPDGRIFCSALPMTRPINITDRSYFRRAIQSRDFSIGDYQIGRITGISAINFGYSVFDAGGNIKAVVFAALDLSWLNKLITGIELPAGSTLKVVDSRGTILARLPEPDKWVGKSMRASPLVSAILANQREGTAEDPGLDGVTRLYAFTPLHNSPTGNVYVSVGIPKAVAFAAVNRDFARNVALLLLVAVLALIAAWMGSNVFVLRRIQALTGAARRLGQGDLSARTGLPHSTEELGQLARTFDDMAGALQRINRALKTLSAGNRAVVRANNEQTLLAEMCRIIVEIGGYRLAWVGYAEQDQHKTVRPVAQAGYEEGYLAALNLTWADTEHGRGPNGTAIRTGQPCIVRNIQTDPVFAPWREEARKRGYGSAMAFPLHVNAKVVGALCIYAEEPDAFDQDEVALLSEMANDLAYGIAALSTRAEREQAHDTIRRMAYHDSLTDLPNHAYLEERVQQALSEASTRGQSLAVLLLDLDRFREINDGLGFHQGDMLLKDVGRRIRGALKEDELVARMRGDEFGILLPVSDTDHAAAAALRILDALGAPFTMSDLMLNVSAAVGISLFPQHGSETTRLIRHADVAMRQAKKSGKGYTSYTAEQDEGGLRRLALAGELRRAIEEDELVLHYQPKIDTRTGQVCGAEALVRWIHPQQGMIPPDEFIPLAEHTGLIKPLTDWVVAAALRQSSDWRHAGVALPVAVNLSARNLRDAELLSKMARLVAAWGAEASWLELEITESAVMDDPEGALEILRRLSILGFTLFIDDFGTGYSSLGYLKKLPVNAVKIDKSFVIDMLKNADSASIVRATVVLAHDLGLKVVAEGIENQATWNRLAALGCDVVQGYYISKPLPAKQFKEWLDDRARLSKAGRRARNARLRSSRA